MGKRIVATTSTSCLDYHTHPYDIRIIRIRLYFGETCYLDGLDIVADTFYEKLRANPDLIPTTSQPSPGQLLEFFEGLAEEGYDEVIVTTLSQQLSGTYNGINQVALMLEDRIKIHVVDTKTVCFSEGIFALEAAKMIKEGIDTPAIIDRLHTMRERNTIFFAVDSLAYLVKNGRLSGAQGFIGTMLKIKPILQVTQEGKIESIEKIRTTRKALEGVAEKVLEYVSDKPFDAYILYTGNPSLRTFFLEILKEKTNLENLYEAPSTPVVGAHVGFDVIGIGIFLKG